MSFREPPLASVLATAGNLVFLPDAAGIIHAYNAETGKELWSHNDGIGHAGGIISYCRGRQAVHRCPGGLGQPGRRQDYGTMFGEEPWKSMPTDAGAMIVYALPSSH